MNQTISIIKLETQIQNAAQTLASVLLEKKWKMACAESCTGGGLGFSLTSLAGSSAWFDGGFITYSNENKITQLNISPSTLEIFGAVSEETAIAMAKQTQILTKTDISISITGIAGPSGGSFDKPVGLVCFGLADCSHTQAIKKIFSGDRKSIRLQSILFALKWMIEYLR